MWWHSYSKITVCLLLGNISLKYGQDSNIYNLESPKPAQASKKTNKPIDAPNLHKHQKKQKKTLDAPNLQRHQQKKNPGTMGPLLSSCWVFCFFCFFGACQCFVKSESPNLHRHQKKQKNQTTRCTKPAQAPKKTKKLKFPGTMGPLLSSC